MKIFLKVLLIIAILIGGSVLAFNIYINVKYPNQVKNASMTYEQLTKLAKEGDNERVNILLLGVDNLSADDNKANMRTDTMMVFSLDPKTKKSISVFVDTKNYSSASNMFKDLGQFKAYLGAIDNFDNLYIIQQGGRGVTREQIINRLKNVLNKGKNKDEIFEVIWKNETLRKNVFGQMSDPYFKIQAKSLFVSKINNKTLDIFNSILITK